MASENTAAGTGTAGQDSDRVAPNPTASATRPKAKLSQAQQLKVVCSGAAYGSGAHPTPPDHYCI